MNGFRLTLNFDWNLIIYTNIVHTHIHTYANQVNRKISITFIGFWGSDLLRYVCMRFQFRIISCVWRDFDVRRWLKLMDSMSIKFSNEDKSNRLIPFLWTKQKKKHFPSISKQTFTMFCNKQQLFHNSKNKNHDKKYEENDEALNLLVSLW